MPKSCFVAGCRTGLVTDRRKLKLSGKKCPSLFKPPIDPHLFHMWQKVIPRADRKLSRKDSVCELHFREEEDIIRDYTLKLFDGNEFRLRRGHVRLKEGVIPSIFTGVPGHSTYKKGLKENVSNQRYKKKIDYKKLNDAQIQKKSPEPNHESANPSNSDDKEIVSLESLLSDPTSDIYRAFFGQTSGTSNTTSAAQNPTDTIADSVSSENNCSDVSDDTSAVNKLLIANSPTDKHTSPNIGHLNKEGIIENYLGKTGQITNETPLAVNNLDKNIIFKTNLLNKNLITDGFSFDRLRTNIHLINKPNSWWGMNVIDKFIICSRWTADLSIDRKLVIHEDLSVKVFFKDKETSIGVDLKIDSVENASKLIHRIENIKMCPNINEKDDKCLGYIQGLKCWKKNLCLGCIEMEKKKSLQEKRRLQKEISVQEKQCLQKEKALQLRQHLQNKRQSSNEVELLQFHLTF